MKNESIIENNSAEFIILLEQKHWQEHLEFLTHLAMRKNYLLA